MRANRIIGCVAACSIVMWAFLSAECAPPESDPIPLQVELASEIRADFRSQIRTDFGRPLLKDFAIATTHDGAIWIFGTTHSELLSRRYESEEWSQGETIHSTSRPGMLGNTRVRTALQPDGNPLVIWKTHGDRAMGRPVRGWTEMARWDGNGWINQQDPNVPFGPVVTDSAGAVHLVYRDALKPKESYRVGPDTDSPAKPHHLTFDGVSWGSPRPMAGRSRWHYTDDFSLRIDSHGALHMVCSTNTSTWLDYGPDIIEHWMYEEGKWTGPEQIRDAEPSVQMRDPILAVDQKGNFHLAYTVHYKRKKNPFPWRSRYRVKRNDKWTSPQPVGNEGHGAVIANDAEGRVYLFWKEGWPPHRGEMRAYLRVWDSKSASERINVPIGSNIVGSAQFTSGPDGAIYVSWREGSAVVIRRILVSR